MKRPHAYVVCAIAAALAVTGCSGDSPADPEPTGSATFALPTDCSTLATEPTRQEAIGDLTLQSNGEGFVRPVPETSTLALGCDWIVGDSTGMLLLISDVEESNAVEAALEDLPSVGYTCQYSHDFAAQFCALPGAGPDTEELIISRDHVWIYLSTANRNGRAFLAEIVEGIVT